MENEQSPAPENSTDKTPTQDQTASRACRLGDDLKEARQCYDNLRSKATERLKNVRATTMGDVLDGAASFVKRHPQCSLGIAATLGFFVARLFRR